MKVAGTVLLAWWLYVNQFVLFAPFPSPSWPAHPYPYPGWAWIPRERFLHQEFCELNARQLRREGLQAICLHVDDGA